MGKPSIFSSQYQKKMKRRKKRAVVGIISIIAIVVIVTVFSKTNFNGLGKAVGSIMKSSSPKTTKQVSNKTAAVEKDKTVKKAVDTKQAETKTFVVTMPSGKKATVVYDNTKTVKVIKSVENNDTDLDYNINPSGSAMILFQKSTQDTMLANSDGTSSNITNASYVSGSGQTFNKDAVLKSNPGYIWAQSPKFIDDSNIAYISQLPWFNKNNKYIWKYNVQGKTNVNTNVTGLDVKINNVVAKGLEIVTDNKTQYLKGDGSLSN